MDHSTTSGLSALPHGPQSIRDHVLHYFECIEIADRPAYLLLENPIWQYERDLELRTLGASVNFMALSDEDRIREADRRVQRKIRSVAIAIDARYSNIFKIRRQLRVDQRFTRSDPRDDGNLISLLEKSGWV